MAVLRAALAPQEWADPREAGVVLPVRLEDLEGERFRLLPGVGPVLAERLEAARRARQAPLDEEAAAAVRGVGPALLERWRDLRTR